MPGDGPLMPGDGPLMPGDGPLMENHRKIIGKQIIIIMTFFGNFMVKLYLNHIFNGLIFFPASFRSNKIPISLF